METTNHLIATELLLYLYYKSEDNILINERLEILLDSNQHLLFSNTPDFIQRNIAYDFVAKYCTPDNRNQYLFIKAVQEQINKAEQDIDIDQILHNINSIANQYLNAENVISTLKKFKKNLKKKTIAPPEVIKKRQLISYVITGFIIIIIGIFSIIYETTISGDQLFKQKSLTFTSFNFNREAVYKTSLPNPTDEKVHLLKQAIFYLQGEASISFNPADLQYNEKTGVLTYFYKPNHIFDIHTKQSITLIDQLPLIPIEHPIDSMVGVVTAIGTNKNEKIQYYLNEYLSKNKTPQLISPQDSIAIDGSTLLFITSQELDQLKKSSLLSTAEIQTIEPLAITLLQAVLLNDQTLQNYFRTVFEQYLRAMYATQDIHLEKIVYKELKK